MAVSVDWGAKIITVPKADTTLVSAGPPEIRSYDVNAFRLELKALEASANGMPHLDTHRHNTEAVLSGLTYARLFEIINGYTVTFEAGLYTVVLSGANHNIADVQNQNGVGIVTQNSGGLLNNNADLAAQVWAADLSAVTVEGQAGTMLRRVFEMMGLRLGSPYFNSPTSITVAGMVFSIVESPPGTFTMTRTS